MRFAIIAISVLLVWALPPAAAQAGASETAKTTSSKVAAKKRALKKALNRDLKRCRSVKKQQRRKTCVRKSKQRYRTKLRKIKTPIKVDPKPKPGAVHRVDVIDDYFVDLFSPDYLEIKSGDVIEWVWNDNNQNPHNVTLEGRPAGVNSRDYMTPNAPSRNYRWSRQLNEVGTWQFVCSLHKLMRMTVKVDK